MEIATDSVMQWSKSIGMTHKNPILGVDAKAGRYLYAKSELTETSDKSAVTAILTPDRDQRLYNFGLNYIIQAIERNETVIVLDRFGSYERGVRDILRSLPDGMNKTTLRCIDFDEPENTTASWCMLDELASLNYTAAITLAYKYAGIFIDNHPWTKSMDAEQQNFLRNYIYLTLLTCNAPVFDGSDDTGKLLMSMRELMDIMGHKAAKPEGLDKDTAYDMYSWLRAEVERSWLPRTKEDMVQTRQYAYDLLLNPMLMGEKLFGVGEKRRKNVFDSWNKVVFVRPPRDENSFYQPFVPMFMHYLYTLHYVRNPEHQLKPPRFIDGVHRRSMSHRYTVMFMDMPARYYDNELLNFATYYKSFGVSTVFAIDDFGGMCQSRYGEQAMTDMLNTADYTILHPAECMWQDSYLTRYLSVDKHAQLDDLHRYGSVQVYGKGQRSPAIVKSLNSDDLADSLRQRMYKREEKKRKFMYD